MHGLPVSCPFNFPNGNLKQQLSHMGFLFVFRILMQKNKLNLRICDIHLLNPYKTVVSHLKSVFLDMGNIETTELNASEEQ